MTERRGDRKGDPVRGRRRALAVLSLCVMFGVLLWAAVDGRTKAADAADLARENAGLRGELVETRTALDDAVASLDALSDRIGLLEDEIRRLGGEVPPSTTVVVEDRRSPAPPAPRAPPPTSPPTTSPPATTTTTEPCVLSVLCLGGGS